MLKELLLPSRILLKEPLLLVSKIQKNSLKSNLMVKLENSLLNMVWHSVRLNQPLSLRLELQLKVKQSKLHTRRLEMLQQLLRGKSEIPCNQKSSQLPRHTISVQLPLKWLLSWMKQLWKFNWSTSIKSLSLRSETLRDTSLTTSHKLLLKQRLTISPSKLLNK